MSSLPIREENAYLAELLLKKEKYDLFLFIEDEKLKIMYEVILEKLFNEVKLGKIFSMKSKGNVLKEFEQWKKIEKKTKNKVLFIVDKDFDHLVGNSIPAHNNLIELEFYTIENYLISKRGALYLLKHREDDYDPEELEERLNWEYWLSSIFHHFEKLFLSYALAFKYDLGENCGISPHRYLEPKGFEIKFKEVEGYIAATKQAYKDKYNEDAEEKIAMIKSSFILENEFQYHQLISGKYLLEALIKYVDSLTSPQIIDKNLVKTTLLKESPIENFSFLQERIISIVK